MHFLYAKILYKKCFEHAFLKNPFTVIFTFNLFVR